MLRGETGSGVGVHPSLNVLVVMLLPLELGFALPSMSTCRFDRALGKRTVTSAGRERLSKAFVSLRTTRRSFCKAAFRPLSSLSSCRNSSVASRVQVEKRSQLRIPAAMASKSAPLSVLSGFYKGFYAGYCKCCYQGSHYNDYYEGTFKITVRATTSVTIRVLGGPLQGEAMKPKLWDRHARECEGRQGKPPTHGATDAMPK